MIIINNYRNVSALFLVLPRTSSYFTENGGFKRVCTWYDKYFKVPRNDNNNGNDDLDDTFSQLPGGALFEMYKSIRKIFYNIYKTFNGKHFYFM